MIRVINSPDNLYEQLELKEKTLVKSKPNVNKLFGMFDDRKLSSLDFIKQKAIEKEMEN